MPHLKREPPGHVVARFVELAKTDQSGLVRLALASTLQRLPIAQRPALAKALATRSEDADDHNLPALVWYGLAPVFDRSPTSVVATAVVTKWPILLRWISRRAAATPYTRTLIHAATADPTRAPHILGGFADAFKGAKSAPRPPNWSLVVTNLSDTPETAALVQKLNVLFGDKKTLDKLRKVVNDENAQLGHRQIALRTLIDAEPDDLRQICETLLTKRGDLNTVAITGLAKFDDPEIGQDIARNYKDYFGPLHRRPAIDVLCSRPSWANALLDEIDQKNISHRDLTPFHARQLLAFKDKALNARLKTVWGDVRASDKSKHNAIKELRRRLTPEVLARADKAKGRAHFQTLCASCHVLYGEGGKLGPDLTGSGRTDLDYLLDNVVDPSGAVAAMYRMTTLHLKDGRVLTGFIASSNEKALTLRQLVEDVSVEKSQIKKQVVNDVSLMPEGLLKALDADGVRDLIAYLMHPKQVELE
jgi:putative heme-binding domain-containing protein